MRWTNVEYVSSHFAIYEAIVTINVQELVWEWDNPTAYMYIWLILSLWFRKDAIRVIHIVGI